MTHPSGTSCGAMTAEDVVMQFRSLEAAFRDDISARSRQWTEERKEIEARHASEVARLQGNVDANRALQTRSVEASERWATALERIAAALEVRP